MWPIHGNGNMDIDIGWFTKLKPCWPWIGYWVMCLLSMKFSLFHCCAPLSFVIIKIKPWICVLYLSSEKLFIGNAIDLNFCKAGFNWARRCYTTFYWVNFQPIAGSGCNKPCQPTSLLMKYLLGPVWVNKRGKDGTGTTTNARCLQQGIANLVV